MKNILCISLTPIERDARVLRQVKFLSGFGEVTTVGFGSKPEGASYHIQVPDGLATLPQTIFGVIKLLLRLHSSVECQSPASAWVVEQNIHNSWDLVVANDARVLDLAFKLAGDAPLWADMHEWAPEERTHILSWRVLVAPFMVHLCQKYLPHASLITTVSEGIADLYQKNFGVNVQMFKNACVYQNLQPSEVDSRNIRCVHSGAAIHGRGLEQMLRVFAELSDRFTLDLYLVEASDGGAHLRELKSIASNDSRVTFRDPVAPGDLPATLSAYDVGVFWIPPTHTNARLTLPNKFFDFVQARLALAIGPSEEMVGELSRYGLGVVSESFEDAAIISSMEKLTTEKVVEFKQASHRAANELSFEKQAERVEKLLTAVL